MIWPIRIIFDDSVLLELTGTSYETQERDPPIQLCQID
jgi:hypothetical protein